MDYQQLPQVPATVDPPLVSMSFPRHSAGTDVPCPIAGCPGSATTRSTMRRHFTHRPRDSVLHITEDGPPPQRCELCDMPVTAYALRRGHRFSAVCRAGAARRRQALAIRRSHEALDKKFFAYGIELEQVTTFRYLGRPLSATDNDWPALYWNLRKARQRWAQISRVLAREGASPKVSGMFYKAIVQSVLLYGVETWVISSPMLQALRGFHHRIARCLTGRQGWRLPNGTWDYPPVEEALEAAGLQPIEVYIDRRRRYLVRFMKRHPILELCKESSRLSGTPTGTRFWWDQDLPEDVE